MSTQRVNYVYEHRQYIYSPEYSEVWQEWKRTAGNFGPFVLTIAQAVAFAYPARIPREIPIFLVSLSWVRWWIVCRPRESLRFGWGFFARLRNEFRSCPPVCRAHGFPPLRKQKPKVQRHHYHYKMIDYVIKQGGDMSDPEWRAVAASRESNWNAMAVCNFDHEAIEHLLKFMKWTTGKSKKSLRWPVSWGWVLFVRSVPVLALAWGWNHTVPVVSKIFL